MLRVLASVGVVCAVCGLAEGGGTPPLYGAEVCITDAGPGELIALGDLDGDGDSDLVIVASHTGLVTVRFNNGDGTFGGATGYAAGAPAPEALMVRDIDGDGDEDLVVVSFGVVNALLNEGDGGFAPAVPSGVGPVSFAAMGDLDGDGQPDLALAAGIVSVVLNAGGGAFAAPVDYASPGNVNQIEIADVDGDGDNDVVGLDAAFSAIVMLNAGDGTLGPATAYPAGSSDLVVGDLDGDGDVDLVAISTPADAVVVLLNDGDGTFAPGVEYSVDGTLNELVVGDLDGDGDRDLVAVLDDSGFGVLLNNGAGSFGEQQPYLVFDTESAAIGDIDGDGLNDIVVSKFNGYCTLVNLLPAAPPTVTSQPAPVVLLPVGGGTAEFGASAVGAPPLSYQWRKDGVDLVEGGAFAGVTTPTLTVSAAAQETGIYELVVTNGVGQAVSSPGVLAVRPSCPGDTTGDGVVDSLDLNGVLANFGEACGE